MYSKKENNIKYLLNLNDIKINFQNLSSELLLLLRSYVKTDLTEKGYKFGPVFVQCSNAIEVLGGSPDNKHHNMTNPEEFLSKSGFLFRHMINKLSSLENNPDAHEFVLRMTNIAKNLYTNWEELDKLLNQKIEVFPLSSVKHPLSPINVEQNKKDFEALKTTADNQRIVESPEDLAKVKLIQRQIRSYHRKIEHEQRFFRGQEAQSEQPVFDNPLLCMHKELVNRLKKVLPYLAIDQKIINSELNHITTFPNLKNIIKTHYFMGSDILKNESVPFTSNVLSPFETQDQQVICFGPGHIDAQALFNLKGLKSGVCNVIVKVNKFNNGTYNQFMKLADFGLRRVIYDCKINEDLSFHFYATGARPFITISLKKESEIFSIAERDGKKLFYGNIEKCNQFCLANMFNMLSMRNTKDLDKEYNFLNNFFNYLEDLSDAELTKVIIIMAQGITIYSEYNFNGYLDLADISIQEIRLYNENLKFNLRNMDMKEYQEFLNLIQEKPLDELKHYAEELPNNETVTTVVERGYRFLLLNGSTKIDQNGWHGTTADYSTISAENFISDKYIETRPGVYNNQDVISTPSPNPNF